MGCDHATLSIDSWEKISGVNVPKDDAGGYLDWREVNKEDNTALALTDPYGVLAYAVGNGEYDEIIEHDWCVFFDYAELPDGRIVLDSVVDSESGGFIDGFEYYVVDRKDAEDTARGMVDMALEGVVYNEVRHDPDNGDPYKFANDVAILVSKPFSGV